MQHLCGSAPIGCSVVAAKNNESLLCIHVWKISVPSRHNIVNKLQSSCDHRTMLMVCAQRCTYMRLATLCEAQTYNIRLNIQNISTLYHRGCNTHALGWTRR